MKITKRQLLDEIRSTGGNYSAIARKYEMTRQGIAKRVEANQTLIASVEAAREELLDIAESGLREAVAKKKSWAIRFVLCTLGKDRGYGKQVKVETHDNDIQVVHHYINDGRNPYNPGESPPLPKPSEADANP